MGRPGRIVPARPDDRPWRPRCGGYCAWASAGRCQPARCQIEGTNTLPPTQTGSGERDAGDPAQLDLQLGPDSIDRAQALIDELSRAHSLQHCALFLWDPAVGRLRLAAQHWGAGEDLGEVRVGAWTIGLNGVCGRAFTTGLPALVPDVEDDPDFLSFPGAGRAASWPSRSSSTAGRWASSTSRAPASVPMGRPTSRP